MVIAQPFLHSTPMLLWEYMPVFFFLIIYSEILFIEKDGLEEGTPPLHIRGSRRDEQKLRKNTKET